MSTYANGTTATKKSSGTSALAKNKMKAPGMKVAEWRASSNERWGVARAKMQEKFSRMGASMSYRVFSVTHPLHPVRRRAAEDAAKEKKALAHDVRLQKEAAVHSAAAAKRARAHESRVATLNEAVNGRQTNVAAARR
jgi:hypothetical protein